MARLDGRYTQQREYNGHISGKPRWMARFCDEVIGNGGGYSSKRAAKSVRMTYEIKRQKLLTEQDVQQASLGYD